MTGWRPERAAGRPPPDRGPVLSHAGGGSVGWNDLVKGPIEFQAAEAGVLLRADGVPLQLRRRGRRSRHDDACDCGDDHVNNTPRQITSSARSGEAAEFAHVPMILGATASGSRSAMAR
jgi:glutamyl/glutaminyl-tRNA synthetase